MKSDTSNLVMEKIMTALEPRALRNLGDMAQRRILSITTDPDESTIVIRFDDGKFIVLGSTGDCCDHDDGVETSIDVYYSAWHWRAHIMHNAGLIADDDFKPWLDGQLEKARDADEKRERDQYELLRRKFEKKLLPQLDSVEREIAAADEAEKRT